MRKRFLTVLVSAAVLAGCNPELEMNSFTAGEDIRLVVGKSEQFVYDPHSCQIAFSRDKNQFRAHTDNSSDYFIADLSATPSSYGQVLSANISWTTRDNVVSRKNLTLEVTRLEGDKVWLWSKSGHIGMTIRVLD